VIAIQVTERNGSVVGAIAADDNDEVMLISGGGTLVRTRVNEISVMGRNTQGVRLIMLAEDESLVGIERIVEERDDEDESEQADSGEDAEQP
jgi:DNA gyrase subunit A